MEVVIVHLSQGLSGGFAMYVVCLSQYLAQHSFVVVVCLFLIEAVLWAIWVTQAQVFLKGHSEPLAGAELLLKEGEVQGRDQIKMLI